MIGAGGRRAMAHDREKLDFSNYGARRRQGGDGWPTLPTAISSSAKMAATRALHDRHYTNQFSGTSSASPIVAGAAVLVQASEARGRC